MNHDRVKMFREKLDSFTISDYHGLNSPGLTCYLNSVLQVLFMTEDFREAVKRDCSKDSTTIDPHLGKLFADLQKSIAKTDNVTKKLGITNVYEQRDAAEYFEKILCLSSPEASKIFKGELNHKTTCLKCKGTNDSRSFFWILPLAMEKLCGQTYSVEKGLKAFFKGEKVCGDDKLYCKQCNEKQDADFGCEITQHPQILTLLLKRFSFDYKRRRYVKLHCKVDVPQTLHMENCKYDLYALVNHFGNLTGGHYTAQIKSFETQVWYHFNDDIVEGVKQPLFWPGDKPLSSCTAYLLMYRKVSRHPEKTDDEGDRDSQCAQSDVVAEGRHDGAEGGEANVPHHHLKDESCNGGENFKHLNGDLLKSSLDDTVRKKLPNLPGELEPSLQTQTSNFAKLQKDGGQKSHEPNRQQVDTNSKEHMCHLNTGGSSTVHLRTHVGCTYERNHKSQKKRLKGNETDWETQNNIDAKTGTETTSVTDGRLTRNGVKPTETKIVNIERKSGAEVRTKGKRKEAGVSAMICESFRVSSSAPYFKQTGHLQGQFIMNEPTECNYSPNLGRKSNSSKRNEEKMQHVVIADSSCKLEATQTVKKGEKTASPVKVKRAPWRS